MGRSLAIGATLSRRRPPAPESRRAGEARTHGRVFSGRGGGAPDPGAFHGGRRVGAPALKASVEGVGGCLSRGWRGGKGKSLGGNSLLLAEFFSLPPLSSPGSPVSAGLRRGSPCPSVRPPHPHRSPSPIRCFVSGATLGVEFSPPASEAPATDGPMDGQTGKQAWPAAEWRGAAWRGSSPEFLPLPGVGWAGPGPRLPLRLPQASAASSPPPSSPLSPLPSLRPPSAGKGMGEREGEREGARPALPLDGMQRSVGEPAGHPEEAEEWLE